MGLAFSGADLLIRQEEYVSAQSKFKMSGSSSPHVVGSPLFTKLSFEMNTQRSEKLRMSTAAWLQMFGN